MRFIELIIQERKKKGWSQSRLAKEAGVSREFVSKLEKGENSPRLITAEKLCKALGVSFVINW